MFSKIEVNIVLLNADAKENVLLWLHVILYVASG